MTSEAKASPMFDFLVLKSRNSHIIRQVGNCNWDYKAEREYCCHIGSNHVVNCIEAKG